MSQPYGPPSPHTGIALPFLPIVLEIDWRGRGKPRKTSGSIVVTSVEIRLGTIRIKDGSVTACCFEIPLDARHWTMYLRSKSQVRNLCYMCGVLLLRGNNFLSFLSYFTRSWIRKHREPLLYSIIFLIAVFLMHTSHAMFSVMNKEHIKFPCLGPTFGKFAPSCTPSE